MYITEKLKALKEIEPKRRELERGGMTPEEAQEATAGEIPHSKYIETQATPFQRRFGET